MCDLSVTYYPSRNASIAMFGDVFSNYDGARNEITGIYPLFQQLDFSGNTLQSVTGAGVCLTESMIFLSTTTTLQDVLGAGRRPVVLVLWVGIDLGFGFIFRR